MFRPRCDKTIDMTSGSLWRNTLLFALPLFVSGLLQLLFNAADTIVVGRFSGQEALAAVGSVGSLNSLLINIFIGLSTGANVTVARALGAGDREKAGAAVHTAVSLSLISGVFLAFLGYFAARPLLLLMGTPDDVIELAVLYVRIIFLGMPVQMLYNFSASILRAAGDTKRPLYFLTVSGLVNIALNLLFVIVFKMSVAGVALATVLSHFVSAGLVVRSLLLRRDAVQLHPRRLRIDRPMLLQIVRIGLPSGIQGSMFSISNTLIQSAINSFGTVAMAGSAAASNLCSFLYQGVVAFQSTATTFTGQNVGAKKYRRVLKTQLVCQLWCFIVTTVMGALNLIFGEELLSLYNSDPEVIRWGMQRIVVANAPEFLMGIMSVFSGGLRGMGYSFLPMCLSLSGICLLRVVWLSTVFRAYPTMTCLMLSHPVSWVLTGIPMGIFFFICLNRLKKKLDVPDPAAP
ncbi:MAG: MATE family efflux transporter [Clostridia bacterium]|nr:MATE family efflux transporter [Clostridia bacterium]